MDPSYRRRASAEANARKSSLVSAAEAADGARARGRGQQSSGGATEVPSGGHRRTFNKSMRKPSMRFGRAGASIQESAAAFIGEGVEEGDEEAGDGRGRGGSTSERRPSGQSRRVSSSGNSKSTSHRRPSDSVDPSTVAEGEGQRYKQSSGGHGHRRRSSSRPSSSQGHRGGESGAVPKRRVSPAGPIPSMADASLKELIEASLNEEKMARAPMLRTSTSPNPTPLRVALMGRVVIPATKGTSLPVGSNGRDRPRLSRSRVHSVCLVVEERSSSSGSYWSGSVRDITVHPGPEGREIAEKTVATNRSWSTKDLSGVEKREIEGAMFTLIFETGRSSTSTAGHESSYTWEGVNTAACDEILWGILTLNRAMQAVQDGDELEPVNVSLKELDATAVYHGLATKHPLVPKVARQMRSRERGGSTANGNDLGRDRGDGGGRASASGRRSSGGGRRGSETGRSSVDKGRRRSSKGSPKWDYEEFEQGETVLGRLKWLEKGREGLLEELSEELEDLEGSTIQQLIAWSEKTDETETLISLLDEVDEQLQVMEGWLEQHGRPLEAMQVDMAEIERKNNKLDVQWRNYQDLYEYLKHLVEAISISPSNESMLRNPQVVLDAALTTGDEDPTPAVEKVVAATESLSAALAAIAQLAAHESTSSLQLLPDQRTKLMGLAEITCSQLMGFCRRLLKRLASQDSGSGGGGDSAAAALGATRDRRNSGAADTSTQRLMLAQRQFHGHLIDYELIFAQVRKMDKNGSGRSSELQIAYAEDLNQGILKARIKSYFADLIPRIVFHHSSPGLSAMERSSIGDSPDASPSTPGPALSALQLTPVDALKQCLDHTMPAVAREQAFFSTLFGLDPAKDPQDRDSGGEAQKAYQKLVIALFNHIEEVASGNPKYEHMVRLENYHFFAATIRPLKVEVLDEYVEQAESLQDLATTRYLEWLVGYQFPALTQFFARVEELVLTVGAADVTYHEPRRNLESTLKKQGDMKVATLTGRVFGALPNGILDEGLPKAVQPIERRPYVPGVSDLADSLNFDVITDEDFHKMSEGLSAFEEDDSPSSESDSTYSNSSSSGGDGDGGGGGCSLLSMLGGRELTAADDVGDDASSRRPLYAAPFDPSLRATPPHNAGFYDDSNSGGEATAAGTGGGNGYVGVGSGSGGGGSGDEKKDNGVIQSSFHELFGGSDGACAVADHFAALPVGKSSPSFTSHQSGDDVDNAAACAVLALAAVGTGGAFVAGSSGRFGEDVVTFGGGLTAGEVERRVKAEPSAEVGALPDSAVEPKTMYDNRTAAAALSPEAWVMPESPPSAAQVLQRNDVSSTVVDGEVGQSNAYTAVVVPNNTRETEAGPIPVGVEEGEDDMTAEDAAVEMRSSQATAPLAAPDNGFDMEADIAPVFSRTAKSARLAAVVVEEGLRDGESRAVHRAATTEEALFIFSCVETAPAWYPAFTPVPEGADEVPGSIASNGEAPPTKATAAVVSNNAAEVTLDAGTAAAVVRDNVVELEAAVQPIERRPYVPGVSDLADSLNCEVMTDEDFHRMSEGFFAVEEDDSPSSESDSTYSNSSSSGSGSGGGGSLLSMLGGRELTTADIGDDACRRPLYASPFDPSLRATTPHNAGFYDDSNSGGEATAAGTGGGTGGGNGYTGTEKKDNGVIQSSFHELFGVSDGACAVADHFAALPVGKSSPSFTSHQSGDDVDNAAACAVLALAAVGAGGAFVAGSSGRFGEEVVTFGGGLSAGGETMASGQDQEVPEASITPDTLPDDAVDVTPNSQAEPRAEVRAVPDSTVDPEMVYDNGTAAATMGPEAWVMPESPLSADPVLEGNEVPSVAVDGLVRQSSATTAAVVPNNTPEAGAGPIPAAREDTDDMIVNDAAVEMRSNQAELVVASNVGAAAAPDIGVGMMAGIADLLPNGEIEAATGDGGEQGGGAQAREKQNVVGDAVEGTFGGDKGPLTSADKATADTADTAATTPTSWLGWLSMAKHAIVTAALPRVNSTTDGKKKCLGAGWRPYPGGVLYRRDVGIPAVEGTFGVRGHKNRALWYS
eukprot:g16809.t1